MSARGVYLRGLVGAVALVTLALAGFALGATRQPNATVSSLSTGRTLTVTGTNLNRLRSLLVAGHRVRFTVVSRTKIVAKVPIAWQTDGTRFSFVFAKITASGKLCSNCDDDWSPTG